MYPVVVVVGKHSGQHHLGVLEHGKHMRPYILPLERSVERLYVSNPDVLTEPRDLAVARAES